MIVFALVLAQDPLARPVTLRSTVANAKAVVRALAEGSGIKLAVHSSLEQEIVGLAAPHRPLKEAMDALGKALDAEWSAREGVYTLARSNALNDARFKRDRETRVRLLRKHIAEATKDWSKTSLSDVGAKKLVLSATTTKPASEGISASSPTFLVESPAHQLFVGLIASLPEATLANMRIDEFKTFASAPNAVQKAFPPSAPALIARYAKDQKTLMEAFDGHSDAASQMRTFTYRNDGSVEKIFLTVRRTQKLAAGDYEFHLDIYNQLGAAVVKLRKTIPFLSAQTAQKAPSPYSEVDIPVHPHALRMRAHIQKRMNLRNEAPLFPADMEGILRNPATYEPLAMVAQNPIQEMANQSGQVVAANIPDSLLHPLIRLMGDGRYTLGQWERDLATYHIEALGDGQTKVYRPRLPLLTEEIFTDRAAFGKFLKEMHPEGHARLDSQARLAVAQGERFPFYGAELTNRLGAVSIFGALVYFRFYGLLTETQRARLKNSESISYEDLGTVQREVLRRMVYDNYGWTWITPQPKGTPAETGLYGPAGSIRSEVTERLPKGLPTSTTISGKVSTGETWYAVVDGPGQGPYEASAAALAEALLAKERRKKDLVFGENFRRATKTDWDLSIRLGGGVSLTAPFSDDALSEDIRKFDQLPQSLRDEANRMLALRRQTPDFDELLRKIPPTRYAP